MLKEMIDIFKVTPLSVLRVIFDSVVVIFEEASG